MKNPKHFLFTFLVFLFSFGMLSAKDPGNRKSKSFHPCPVNASAGKRAQTRMTTIHKKGKPAHVKKQKTVKTKTVKQKTVKTKTVKTKTEKVKKEKQAKEKKVQTQGNIKQVSKSGSHGKKGRSKAVSRSVF